MGGMGRIGRRGSGLAESARNGVSSGLSPLLASFGRAPAISLATGLIWYIRSFDVSHLTL